MNFEVMVQKTVNVEAKVSLRSSTMVRDSDINYPRNHCPSNNTALKVQTEGTITKDSHQREPKIKEVIYTSFRAVAASEFLKQARKEKKLKKYPERRDKKKQTSASTTNTIEIQQQKKKKKNQDCDMSEITCYNCNRKGHYANICIEPKN